VLIDGEEALPRIAAAIEWARSHVHIAGWHLTPGFSPAADGRSLRELLGEVAQRAEVRVLLWAGAPLPLFKPTRAAVRRAREELVRGSAVRCALDSRERPLHCHHEKLVIVDDEVAFVGGIDLTSLGGDRFDLRSHPLRDSIGWHDSACEVRGPAVADVAAHFRSRWREITGERLAGPHGEIAGPAGGVELQVVRTVPERVYGFLPRGEFGILESYVRALRSAQRLVYLESQFLWSVQAVELLAEKLREPPCDEFRVVVLLPARPNNGADTTRGQLGLLVEADRGEGRFLAATVRSGGDGRSGPLYVHSKIGIVDDEWLTVGSANLNEHSFFNDTEVNVTTCDPQLAGATRRRLWAEHLERPVEEASDDPAELVDRAWRPIASEQLARVRRGEEQTHRLLELPGVSRRSMALLGPLDSLLVDG
jgi:phosphatidylserine/phosphatidylglycerophosphate/cardiolipin synthase-like enzyme